MTVIKKAFCLAVIVAAGYTAAAQAQVGYYPQPQNFHPQQSNQGRIGDGVPATPVFNRASTMLRQDGMAHPPAPTAPAAIAPVPQPGWSGQGCDSGCDGSGNYGGYASPGCGTDAGCCGSGNCGGGSGCCDAGGGCCGVGQSYFGGGGDCCDTGCGRYLSVFGGWNWLHDLFPDGRDDVRFRTREGWIVGAALGKQINCNLRREFEFAYRRNTVDQFIADGPNGPATLDFDGDIKVTSAMFNLLFQPSCCIMGIRPYAGGGIGLGYIDADANIGRVLFTSDDLAFAWQLRAGVEKQINCNASLFVEYRYFCIPDSRFIFNQSEPFQTDYEAENLVFGINFRR